MSFIGKGKMLEKSVQEYVNVHFSRSPKNCWNIVRRAGFFQVPDLVEFLVCAVAKLSFLFQEFVPYEIFP